MWWPGAFSANYYFSNYLHPWTPVKSRNARFVDFFFPPLTQVLRYSSPGCRRSEAVKSGLCSSGFAPTVYLLVTFAARPQPHHNYPTYSLNRNHAWQEPPATKVGLLKAAFLFREFNSHSIINGLYLFGHQRGCISAWTNRRRGTKLDRLNSLNKEYRGL